MLKSTRKVSAHMSMKQLQETSRLPFLHFVLSLCPEHSACLRLQFTSLACAYIDREEHVQFDKCGEHQEHSVHGEAGAPHRCVQLELVKPERQVQQQERRQQRNSGVLQPHGVDLHLLKFNGIYPDLPHEKYQSLSKIHFNIAISQC